MFKFVEKVFFMGLTILSTFVNVAPLNCVSMKNQELCEELMKQGI